MGSRAADLVTPWIQILANLTVKGDFGQAIPNFVGFGHFLRKIIRSGRFAAYLGIVLVTLAHQHRSFLPLKTPHDRALVPSAAVLNIEGVIVAANIARGLWGMEPLELLSVSRSVHVGLVEHINVC